MEQKATKESIFEYFCQVRVVDGHAGRALCEGLDCVKWDEAWVDDQRREIVAQIVIQFNASRVSSLLFYLSLFNVVDRIILNLALGGRTVDSIRWIAQLLSVLSLHQSLFFTFYFVWPVQNL